MIGPVGYHEASLVDAWARGARHVASVGGPPFIMTLSSGIAWMPSAVRLRQLDAIARKWRWERPSSVSEMILPAVCDGPNILTKDAIDRGIEMLGRARQRGLRFSGWQHTYFERMVGKWRDRDGQLHSIRENKLLGVIDKLTLWDRNAEAACYIHTSIETDGFRTRGGPCLQYVQFRAYGDHLMDVIGLYRAHDYGNKALGNLIGLNRLGSFVARHTKRRLNGVSVVSLHPFASHKGRLADFAADVVREA
jgi:hypothetical protein